jgi:hypothetical protein
MARRVHRGGVAGGIGLLATTARAAGNDHDHRGCVSQRAALPNTRRSDGLRRPHHAHDT